MKFRRESSEAMRFYSAQAEFAYYSIVNRSTTINHFAIVYTKIPNQVADLTTISL